MRGHLGWALLLFFACKSGGDIPLPMHDAGDDAAVTVEAGPAEAGVDASNAPPLDCSQDDPDWPSYNHDVCNTRAPTTAGGLTPQTAAKLAVKWTYAAAGEVTMTPAVVGGQVYVGDWGGMMTRLDAATGNVVWSKAVADLAGFTADAGGPPDPLSVRSTPLVSGNALVFGLSRTGFTSTQSLAYVVAVDTTSGALLWKTLVDDHRAAVITGAAVLEGNRIYVPVSSLEEAMPLYSPGYACCTFRGSVVALDVTTGAVVWKTPMIEDGTYFQSDGKTPAGYAGAAIWSGVPAVDRHRKRLYVTTGNNYAMPSGVSAAPAGDHVESIVALDMTTGAIAWAKSMTTADVWTFTNPNGPDFDFGCGANLFQAKVGGFVKDLVGAGQKSGIYWALDADTGSLVWKTQVGPGSHLGGIHWGTAWDGTHLYFGDNDNDGTSYKLAGSGSQAGQSVTTGSWGALDPAKGDVLWQVANPALASPLGGASVNGPATVVGGVMLVGSMDAQGTMYALDATSRRRALVLPVRRHRVQRPGGRRRRRLLGRGLPRQPPRLRHERAEALRVRAALVSRVRDSKTNPGLGPLAPDAREVRLAAAGLRPLGDLPQELPDERRRDERLGQEGVAPGADGERLERRRGGAGERDDRDVGRPVVGAQAARHLQPVDARQHDVEHHGVRPELEGLLDRARPVGRLEHHEARRRELRGVELAQRVLVLDQQDERAARANPGRRPARRGGRRGHRLRLHYARSGADDQRPASRV